LVLGEKHNQICALSAPHYKALLTFQKVKGF